MMLPRGPALGTPAASAGAPVAARAPTPRLARPAAVDRGRDRRRLGASRAPGCWRPPTTPWRCGRSPADAGAGETGSPRTTWWRAGSGSPTPATLDRYFRVDDTLPADLAPRPRGVGEGELLPARGASAPTPPTRDTAAAAARRRRRAGAARRSVPGSVVDVYLVARRPTAGRAGRARTGARPAGRPSSTPPAGRGASARPPACRQLVVAVPDGRRRPPFYDRARRARDAGASRSSAAT